MAIPSCAAPPRLPPTTLDLQSGADCSTRNNREIIRRTTNISTWRCRPALSQLRDTYVEESPLCCRLPCSNQLTLLLILQLSEAGIRLDYCSTRRSLKKLYSDVPCTSLSSVTRLIWLDRSMTDGPFARFRAHSDHPATINQVLCPPPILIQNNTREQMRGPLHLIITSHFCQFATIALVDEVNPCTWATCMHVPE